jgi:DMSO/TMAO reductase YedYZ molybdopterin-dependent catalytic subunit
MSNKKNNTADILKERPYISEPLSADEARRRMASMTRRSFIIGGGAAILGVLGWRWMPDDTKHLLLRRTLELNERVGRALYSEHRRSPEFSRDQITPARVNGDIGMTGEIDLEKWRLTVSGIAGRYEPLELSIEDIQRLPRRDMIVEFKCIEGWSTITHFGGTRFSDLIDVYSPQNDPPPYVALSTPDGGYYVGWDTDSIMHPQTILCYEMNGIPLTLGHGAPLRLASPTKYGIKQIKRIGKIELTNERPRDYWAENGYDWYAGL